MQIIKLFCTILLLLILSTSPTNAQMHVDPETAFKILTGFIDPSKLKIYENLDNHNQEAQYESTTISQVGSCFSSSQCIKVVQLTNISTGESHRENIQGVCYDDDSEDDEPGTCDYPLKSAAIDSTLIGTDFSDPESQVSKMQDSYSNNWQAGYRRQPNNLAYGSHQLLLDSYTQARMKILYAKRAVTTYNTMNGNASAEFPLGGVDWSEQIPCDGTDVTPVSVYNNLPQSIKDIDSPDWQEQYDRAMATKPPPTWFRHLACIIPYSTSPEYGYSRSSILVLGLYWPGSVDQALYRDGSIPGTFESSVIELKTQYSYDEWNRIYEEVFNHFSPVQYYFEEELAGTPDALPSKILSRGTPYTPIDLDTLGRMTDGVQQNIGYYPRHHSNYIIEEADSVEQAPSLYDRIISSLVTGIETIFNVKRYHITIPGITGQITDFFQNASIDTQTPNDVKKQTALRRKPANALLDENGNAIIGGSGSVATNAKLAFNTYASCKSDIHAPSSTSVKSFITYGTRGCNTSSTITPTGTCDGELLRQLLEGSPYESASDEANNYFSNMNSKFSEELQAVYATAAEETGVPCEVLAGIHMTEATGAFSNSNERNPMDYSLVSGRPIGDPEPDAGGKIFSSLLETAIYAGDHLKNKVGGSIDNYQDLITALSRYNGGGNSNCQTGYPWPIPYSGCPRLFEGEDDPYAMSKLDDRHLNMYLLYCADYTACQPQPFTRPGSFTFSILYYNNFSQ